MFVVIGIQRVQIFSREFCFICRRGREKTCPTKIGFSASFSFSLSLETLPKANSANQSLLVVLGTQAKTTGDTKFEPCWPGKLNPADCGTRDLDPCNLQWVLRTAFKGTALKLITRPKNKQLWIQTGFYLGSDSLAQSGQFTPENREW